MVRQKVMSEEQYLTSKGVGGALSDVMTDKIRAARQKNTSRGQERFERQNKKAIDNYYARREQARREYQRLVSTGKVRKPTETEKLISTAHGQSENRAVQAARRVLAKHGINWKTGKSIGSSGRSGG